MVLSLRVSKITILWAAYIIVSATFMRQVLNFLTKTIGKSGISMMLGILFLAGGVAVFFYLYRSRPNIRRILLFVGVLAAGFLFASRMEIIEERLHLIKFGLLGWLISWDNINLGKDIWRVILPFFFCLLVGAVDEIFQWWIPNRVGDIRDVFFAGVGGLWGTTLFLISNPVKDECRY